MGLRESVQASVSAIADPQDQAAVDLALTYAADIDSGAGDLTKLGPALLAALEALGLTPRARKAVKSDGQQPGTNPLDQLAERRAGRGRPQAVDTVAP